MPNLVLDSCYPVTLERAMVGLWNLYATFNIYNASKKESNDTTWSINHRENEIIPTLVAHLSH